MLVSGYVSNSKAALNSCAIVPLTGSLPADPLALALLNAQ